jgi:hypothetical protein
MKRAALSVPLLVALWATSTPAPQEYSINIHVQSSAYADRAGHILETIIAGKKYRLGDSAVGPLLMLGDYKAKLVKDEHKAAYESDQAYEMLFPDAKTRKFEVIEMSE